MVIVYLLYIVSLLTPSHFVPCTLVLIATTQNLVSWIWNMSAWMHLLADWKPGENICRLCLRKQRCKYFSIPIVLWDVILHSDIKNIFCFIVQSSFWLYFRSKNGRNKGILKWANRADTYLHDIYVLNISII